MMDHEYDTMRAVEDRHWWYRALGDMVVRDLRRMGLAHPNFKILDAGCGTGGMLERLRRHFPGALLQGMDFSPKAVASTRARGFPEVREANVNQLPFETASMDVIISLDVLYHQAVDEPLALAGCHRVLKPGGTLILNLPAYHLLRGRHDLAVFGVRRYRPAPLRALLTKAGFEVATLHAWNLWLFPPLLLHRHLSRFSGASDPCGIRGDLKMPPPLINTLLTLCGALDTRLTRLLRNPLGTSLYAIARRANFSLSHQRNPTEPVRDGSAEAGVPNRIGPAGSGSGVDD